MNADESSSQQYVIVWSKSKSYLFALVVTAMYHYCGDYTDAYYRRLLAVEAGRREQAF